MDHKTLRKLIDDEVSEVDQPFFIISGYFLAWYALVEIHISAQIAFLSEIHDLDVFQILTKGMDARVKLERFRQLAKAKNGIGPNLNARLNHFERTIIPIRNRLSHGAAWLNDKEVGKFHLISIVSFSSAMKGPWHESE